MGNGQIRIQHHNMKIRTDLNNFKSEIKTKNTIGKKKLNRFVESNAEMAHETFKTVSYLKFIRTKMRHTQGWVERA